jgi:hypothetical protein
VWRQVTWLDLLETEVGARGDLPDLVSNWSFSHHHCAARGGHHGFGCLLPRIPWATTSSRRPLSLSLLGHGAFSPFLTAPWWSPMPLTAYAADACCCHLLTLLLLATARTPCCSYPCAAAHLVFYFLCPPFFLSFHLPFQQKQDVEFSIQGDRELNMEHCLEILLPSFVIKKKICHSAY